jgi:hypothetical protein
MLSTLPTRRRDKPRSAGQERSVESFHSVDEHEIASAALAREGVLEGAAFGGRDRDVPQGELPAGKKRRPLRDIAVEENPADERKGREIVPPARRFFEAKAAEIHVDGCDPRFEASGKKRGKG